MGTAALLAGLGIGFTVVCVECGRTFDLTVPADADEWANGHDCEEVDA